jgi:hypothetical protein
VTIRIDPERFRRKAKSFLLVHNQNLFVQLCAGMPKLKLSLLCTILLPFVAAYGQDSKSMEETLLGVWKMEPRILRRDNFVSYQEEATISITERMPDGRYLVIARMTSRVVADIEGAFNIPGCEDKKECIYDDATEGIGSSFRSAFYIDYFAENWIDDLFTVKGNVMTADDGNGPIVLIKVE